MFNWCKNTLKKPRVIFIFKLSIGLLILVFILSYIYQSIDKVKLRLDHFNYLYLFYALLIIMISLVFQHSVWYIITYFSKSNLSYTDSFKIRVYSEMGKYIPGRFVLYGILFYLYKLNNISQKDIASCSMFESLTSLISALIVTLLSIFLTYFDIDKDYKFIYMSLLLLLLIMIHPKILQTILNFILISCKKEAIKIHLNYSNVVFLLLLSVIIWLMLGLSFYFLIKSFYPIKITHYWFLTGSYAISSFIGFIAVFVPAGLGVKEGSLIFFLLKYIPEPYCGIASVSSRLLIIISDVILTCIAFIVDIFSKDSIYKQYLFAKRVQKI